MFFTGHSLEILLRIPVLLLAITFHEYAHARMAYHFGDSTARREGRLTLNPLKHLDPIGTLMLLVVGFGWARPVPINPHAFSRYRQGLFWVSLAGPLTNFGLAFTSMFLFGLGGAGVPVAANLLLMLIWYNVLLGAFNLIPVPPLDGSKIIASLLPGRALGYFFQIEPYAPLILILLIVTGTLGTILWPAINVIVAAMQSFWRFAGLF